MYTLLAIVLAAFIGIPNIIFAQSRDARDFGHAAIPCLCCLDIHVPDFGPVGGIVSLVLLVLFVVFIIWANASEAERQAKHAEWKAKKLEEDKKKWPWLKGKRVKFTLKDSPTEGVVVAQEEDKLKVNYLNSDGTLSTADRTVTDVETLS